MKNPEEDEMKGDEGLKKAIGRFLVSQVNKDLDAFTHSMVSFFRSKYDVIFTNEEKFKIYLILEKALGREIDQTSINEGETEHQDYMIRDLFCLLKTNEALMMEALSKEAKK